ncbi:nuclear transport factor 2 family protein [Shewanella sp.]|jgi:predicted SnoaL-like aldol condensation-catalyzing enzyme|uniref:nuclear transport factor 2 family protein n=2 Tax=Shewanella sp. TaxID=50422 RepID=UPI004048A409
MNTIIHKIIPVNSNLAVRKSIIGALVTSALLSGALVSSNSVAATETSQVEVSYKQQVVELLSSIETGDPAPIGYINPNKYIQHNLAVADGLAGFAAVMQLLPKGSTKAQVKRAFQDGNYVFTHTEYNFFGPEAGFDIFRFEDGKIVEHWDNLQTIAAVNPSGHTQFDGETKVTDLDKTEQNKALVARFVDSILIKGEMAKIGQFIGSKDSDYIQHNPNIGDGLSGLGKALGELAKMDMPMVVKTNHKVLGEGNFVLSISEGTFMQQHVAFYDLFRVENNMIVEHWDTIEAIPAKADWKNSNGKFGF